MDRAPLVSVVTPFFNTDRYLGECIESVLHQTYDRFEYLLVDNKSTDGSRRIAEEYAARDPRIRVIENDAFVDQLTNYNGALARIDAASRYVKVAQADDVLFPDCIRRMVELAESAPSVGLVSSYSLRGEALSGEGIPYDVSILPGHEAIRRMLLERRYWTGSPTTVLYRADLVRARGHFYTPGHTFHDTEAAFDILLRHDFGFVHQVLSFARVDDDSISAELKSKYHWLRSYFLIMAERYGRQVFSDEEFERLQADLSREYHRFLGARALRLPGAAFWHYHRRDLATVGRSVSMPAVFSGAVLEILGLVLSPGRTITDLAQSLRKRARRPSARAQLGI